ncbi:MAG TPA: twin-arginine translocase TatA/TatE family subunit [Anaerolineae bacterium]|nr:twin-arginine translocase TatA/TatE family subunit [Anaerolineae bacterium]
MNFFNIGGGEILVIILMALLLFGPKDIMNIMRTIGRYTRKASRAWAQLTAGLQGELLPDEVQDVVDETKASFAEVGDTFKEIGTVVKETELSVKEEGREIDRSLQVAVPDARAEVQAEIRKKKAERASKAADVEGILAMVGKPAPPKPAAPEAPAAEQPVPAAQSEAVPVESSPADAALPTDSPSPIPVEGP